VLRQSENAIYRILNAAVLTLICLFLPESFLGIKVVDWRNIAVMTAVLIFFTGINFFRARGRFVFLLTALLCVGVSYASVGMDTFLEFLRTYLEWCEGNRIVRTEWLSGCQLLQTAVITAVCYLFQVILEKFRLLRIGVASASVIGLLICLFMKIAIPHMCMVFLFLFLVLGYEEGLQERWNKKRNGSVKGQMIWLSPFLAIYLLLMAVMPAPETPYSWQWAKNIYGDLREVFLKVTQNWFGGGGEEFGMSLSGFSEDGGLGNGFQEDNRELMRLTIERTLTGDVYLIGKVYDTFDGRKWLQENHEGEKERFIDMLETVYAIKRLDGKYVKDYLNETKMRIHYDFFHTGYVFAPLKSENIRGIEKGLAYSFDGGDLRLEKQAGYGTEYEIRYYEMNTGHELFDKLLEATQEPDEALWEIVMGDYAKESGEQITLEMMNAHRRKVYDYYLDEVVLSAAAEDYLAEITEGAHTNIEKLRAIEKVLNSYTYTRTPGKLPDNVTDAGKFLDYFLLESREGYCTYFATAFVLLARAEGIPARYVQGFCAPVGEGMETVVYSYMAHSWPEVYVEGVGWIPFEPTPGYGEYRYHPWSVSYRGSLNSTEEEEEEEEETDEPLEAVVKEEEDSITKEGTQRFWVFLPRVVMALLAGVILVMVIDHMLSRYRYEKLSAEGKLWVEVRRNLWVLSLLGVERREDETLEELLLRGSVMPGKHILHFIEDYEGVVYGGKRAGKEMITGAKREREELLKLLKREKKWTYIYCRMRL
jgi:hypothetical protein